MVRQPDFWSGDRGYILPRLLSPIAAIAAAAAARRIARPSRQVPVPVLCCGNATLGGAGKTTLALDIGQRLRDRRLRVHFLSRGYRGAVRGPWRVSANDLVDAVGDEALLLAAVAPTWVGAERSASACAAVAAGADVLVLDDGLQNPSLARDVSLLVIDGGFGFGNGRVLPAGPLREPVAAAARRCQAAVLIGDDATGALRMLGDVVPVLHARLVPKPETAALSGRRVLAFAGIARPEKFFATLRAVGAVLVGEESFSDHHQFSSRTLRNLRDRAAGLDALLVTTPKDAARLSSVERGTVLVAGVTLAWETPEAIERLLDHLIAVRNTSMKRSMSISSL